MPHILFASFILIAIPLIVQADLPVHCLKHQIVGLWSVEVTKTAVTDDESTVSCGHKRPDDPADSYLSGVDTFDPVTTTIMFQLNHDSTVVKIHEDQNTTGNWTLIYDEGFDIVFDKERFTNFFYYFPADPTDTSLFKEYKSDCGKTTIGWYINNNNERACWKAQKVLSDDENADDLLADQTEQKYIVQPTNLPNSKETSFLQEQSSTSSHKNKRNSLRGAEEVESSLTSTKKVSKYNKNFRNHSEIVHKLNQIENKKWTAKVHPDFESKTLGEINNMAGRKTTLKVKESAFESAAMEDVSDLPKEFDWGHVLGEVRKQQSCGSCYAFATLQMLEARLKILYNETVQLSVQHSLDCAFYNQGCRGGYPYLLELFANQNELVPEECSPYKAKNGQCGTCDVSKLDKVYKTTNFKFIGGSYGKCSQRQMMIELMNNGPVVASFEPTSDFSYYGEGVFHSVDAEWITNGEDKPEWEKVDHSVLLYGWGETEDGMKYWKLRNSWGPDWGENGDFKMKRGVDESAIESLAESADPIIVYRNVAAQTVSS